MRRFFCAALLVLPAVAGQLPVRISWDTADRGAPRDLDATRSRSSTDQTAVRIVAATPGVEIRQEVRAAGSAAFTLVYPDEPDRRLANLHVIWSDLIAQSDSDTVRRLTEDPVFRPNEPKFSVFLNPEGTRGFTVGVHQLLENQALWVPSLHVLVAAGDHPISLADQLKNLSTWKGRRILDQVRTEPEATYAQYTARWEDMGSPAYTHPNQPAPGHIIGLTWDSAIAKFGIDREAGIWNDYGNPDHFRFWIANLGPAKSQGLADGLPIVTTIFEKEGVRYTVEQFAYPLHGPPSERRGDIPMVLLQKIRLTDLTGQDRIIPVTLTERRRFPHDLTTTILADHQQGTTFFRDSAYHRVLLEVDGISGEFPFSGTHDYQREEKRFDATAFVSLKARSSTEFVVKLPSPLVEPRDAGALSAIDYDSARTATLRFWSDWVAYGAQFRVPEKAVNDLFRVTLWHALRLPRRHSSSDIDLPYSNFAYSQTGTPWPVNQAVYVDSMLYDLRGYHAVSVEELRAQFHNNQEFDGHINGFANWLVYTPGMLYAVAQNYLLSNDRQALDRMLPETLKSLDWCLREIRKSKGIVSGPLNDGTGDGFWAFNQAYLYAGLERFGHVLEQIGDSRAHETLQAAATLRGAVAREFGAASARSTLVELRDHTWSPYVPSEARTPRRLLDMWYPSDVDTGAVHLLRLKALPAAGELADALLHDHEDNLYLKGWGMANEPVYNQQATAYLLRDDPKAVVRAFYSYMACAFSHSAFEPVEHRWTHGQYFGPPSTDGAWFELYRNMLLREVDDRTLLIGQAPPRAWLEDGKQIEIERAPTYFGPVTCRIESHAAAGRILATIDFTGQKHPETLLVRLRHPAGKQIRAVTLNGKPWTDFDISKEWIRIPSPVASHYSIAANY